MMQVKKSVELKADAEFQPAQGFIEELQTQVDQFNDPILSFNVDNHAEYDQEVSTLTITISEAPE
jgi:hypothetical protein